MNREIKKTEKNIEKTEKKLKFLKKHKQIKLISENKDKRRERTRKLIKKGVLFYMVNLLEEDDESLLGYLADYSKVTSLEKERLKKNGKNIFEQFKKRND